MDERIEQAFSDTDVLMMELDLSSPQTMLTLQQLMVNPTGPYLSEYVSEDELEEIDQYFIENLGVGLAQLGGLKPLALNSMAMVTGLPCSDVTSYESYFVEQAGDIDMPVLELESPQFQMSIFDNIPLSEQVDWLLEMISDPESLQAQVTAMADAYLSEDLDQLYRFMQEDPQFQDYMETLLDERNLNWIAPIREQIHVQPTFIAVGAGHLPGDEGVIELLKQAGYTVEPINR